MSCSLFRGGSCRLQNALEWWAQGGAGLQMVALCYWELQVQFAGRLITVG